MDGEVTKRKFDWLPAHMPGVAALMREKRTTFGDEHVRACWHNSVIKHEPGWFFAREGPLTIGTPWDDPQLANFAAAQVSSTQALVLMRKPEVANGTN